MALADEVDASDPEAVAEAADEENTYLVLVEPLVLGSMQMF